MQDFSYPLLSISTYADNGSLLDKLRKHCAGDIWYGCFSDREALNSKAITYTFLSRKKGSQKANQCKYIGYQLHEYSLPQKCFPVTVIHINYIEILVVPITSHFTNKSGTKHQLKYLSKPEDI